MIIRCLFTSGAGEGSAFHMVARDLRLLTVAMVRGENGAAVLIRAVGDWQLDRENATIPSKFFLELRNWKRFSWNLCACFQKCLLFKHLNTKSSLVRWVVGVIFYHFPSMRYSFQAQKRWQVVLRTFRGVSVLQYTGEYSSMLQFTRFLFVPARTSPFKSNSYWSRCEREGLFLLTCQDFAKLSHRYKSVRRPIPIANLTKDKRKLTSDSYYPEMSGRNTQSKSRTVWIKATDAIHWW